MKEEQIIFLWHPMKGKRPFNPEHAARLLESEKTNPSGWELFTEEVDPSKDVKEIQSNSEDGIGKRSNSKAAEGKVNKQTGNSRSKKSRE